MGWRHTHTTNNNLPGLPGTMVESYPGLAKYVWSSRLASLLAAFLADWLLSQHFDGLYLDGYVEPDRVDFHQCALHAEGCQSFIKPGRTYDVNGDGKPDSAEQVYGQYFAWAPAFVAMVRARLGARAVLLANSAGSISDTSLSGITIEMEACAGALGGPGKCADALEAQKAASLAAGHQPLSVLWLTHSESIPPQKQCEEVAALQRQYEVYQAQWRQAVREAGADPAAQIAALIRTDFAPEVCNAETLIIWHAFWGEANARPLYAEISSSYEAERSRAMRDACAALLQADGGSLENAGDIAAGIDAMTDGLWLAMYLSNQPPDLERPLRLAAFHLSAAFPERVAFFTDALRTGPRRA